MNIGIVGLGLIGGSMAKSIKLKTLHSVFGVDLDAETMTLARLCGSIDGILSRENIPDCSLILLAVRPNSAVEWIKEYSKIISPETTVVDLCGVKRWVCERITPIATENGFTYIGGHPMAGTERNGFVSSTPELYNGASMILTPDKDTDINKLEMLKSFFTDIGFAGLTFSTPDEHDRIIAYTSQLAHVVSSAYVKSPEAIKRRGFSAGSFRDMTRVARLDENLWTELMMDDSDYLRQELKTLVNNLSAYIDALESDDAKGLCELLKEGREKKAQAGGN